MTLALKNVVRRVGGQTHIHETSIELQSGGFNILLGTTLAGKTTLMQLMAGLVQPNSGQILVQGPLRDRRAGSEAQCRWSSSSSSTTRIPVGVREHRLAVARRTHRRRDGQGACRTNRRAAADSRPFLQRQAVRAVRRTAAADRPRAGADQGRRSGTAR